MPNLKANVDLRALEAYLEQSAQSAATSAINGATNEISLDGKIAQTSASNATNEICQTSASNATNEIFNPQAKFSFMTHEQNGVILVHTSIGGREFFIQLKRDKDCFIIKLDKHSRIDDLALSVAALDDFARLFCTHIHSRAYALSTKRLAPNVIDAKALLSRLNGYKSVLVEIGFGSARQLAYQASVASSDTLLVGIEVYKPAILQASRLLARYDNVVLLNEDARFLFDILPKSSVDRVLLHFPVPWNESKTRRVISGEFLDNLSYALKPSGEFWLRTDDDEYYHDALDMLGGFDIRTHTDAKDNITSKYEARWLKLGKHIYDIYAAPRKVAHTKQTPTPLAPMRAKPLSRQKIVGDGYFLSIENSYTTYPHAKTMLKLSYGSFTKPFHAYILDDEFLFDTPYLCSQNISALNALKELLTNEISLDSALGAVSENHQTSAINAVSEIHPADQTKQGKVCTHQS